MNIISCVNLNAKALLVSCDVNVTAAMWIVKVDLNGVVQSTGFIAGPAFWDFLFGARVIKPLTDRTPAQTAVRAVFKAYESGHPFDLDGLDITVGVVHKSHKEKIEELANADFARNPFVAFELQSTAADCYKLVKLKKGITCSQANCSLKGSKACPAELCVKHCVKKSQAATVAAPVGKCSAHAQALRKANALMPPVAARAPIVN
jgi:hypothetical protein